MGYAKTCLVTLEKDVSRVVYCYPCKLKVDKKNKEGMVLIGT